MHVHFHSDGSIIEIIPDLIDLGVRVINCQANVIGLSALKKRFAGSVCFRTDLDRQKIMPFGTAREVKDHVRNVFDHLGTPGGGIIACGEIGPDTPLDNIRAMYEAFVEYAG
jgi:uroporphyrinogen-III decarboxylase